MLNTAVNFWSSLFKVLKRLDVTAELIENSFSLLSLLCELALDKTLPSSALSEFVITVKELEREMTEILNRFSQIPNASTVVRFKFIHAVYICT